MHTQVSSPTHALVRAPCDYSTYFISLITWQDHEFAGIRAGSAGNGRCAYMNPLDLIKVKFQVSLSTRAPGSGIAGGIWLAL